METQKFCLKWDDFHSSVTSLLNDLRLVDEFCDITLCCDGARLGAHRVLLSACSPYFRQVLKNNACQQHMVFFIKGATPTDLHALVEFIYRGSVNLAQNQLASFIRTAEMLQIRGLSGDGDKSPLVVPSSSASPTPVSVSASACYRPPSAGTPHQDQQHRLPPNKRQRSSVDQDGQDSVLHLSASSPGGVGGGDPDSVSSCASNQSPPPHTSSSTSSHHYQQLQPHSSVPQHPLALAYHHQQQQLHHSLDAQALPTHHHLHHQNPHQSLTQHHQQHQQQHQGSQFKVEKVDMSGDDDVGALGCLEATLGQVAKYEGVFGGSGSGSGGGTVVAAASARLQSQPAVLSINEVHSHMMPGYSDSLSGASQSIINSIDDTAAQAAALARLATTSSTIGPTSGPLSSTPGALGSSSTGSGVMCPKCCRRYRSQQALNNHMKQHMGLTTCPLCGKVSSIVPTLRMHLKKVHSLSEEAVYAMVPFNSPRGRPHDPQSALNSSGAGGTGENNSGGSSSSSSGGGHESGGEPPLALHRHVEATTSSSGPRMTLGHCVSHDSARSSQEPRAISLESSITQERLLSQEHAHPL